MVVKICGEKVLEGPGEIAFSARRIFSACLVGVETVLLFETI